MTTTHCSHKESQPLATKSGILRIGDLSICRLGVGTNRLSGPDVWGEPADKKEAIQVLRQAVDLGINFIDTADSYGPGISESVIAQALHPYPSDLVIATKAGFRRPGPDKWIVDCHPEHLRSACHASLRRLKLQRIDLFQLHRIDPKINLEDQIGALVELQRNGDIRYIGLSEVTVEQLEAIRAIAPILTVQNQYNLIERHHEEVLNYCTRENIGFIPWVPLATGDLANNDSPLLSIAQRLNVTPSQIALAWLLKKSPVMLPIPGTSKVQHLEDNVDAVLLDLDDESLKELEEISRVTKKDLIVY